ncbi:MAG: hypothetical protein WKF61_01760 [Luteimonas sp.]
MYVFLSDQLVWLSGRIGGQADLLKYFGLLPFGLVVYDSKVVKSILIPDGDKLNLFQQWDLYGDFKLGCIVGLIYAVLFAVVGIACFFFDWKVPSAHQSALLLTSMTGALTVSATLYFAHLKIEEMFRRHSRQSP